MREFFTDTNGIDPSWVIIVLTSVIGSLVSAVIYLFRQFIRLSYRITKTLEELSKIIDTLSTTLNTSLTEIKHQVEILCLSNSKDLDEIKKKMK